jgi:hypothetical protein
MGRISIFNGKYVFPVPWKTGAHYSQARLNEFLGSEGIKSKIKKNQALLTKNEAQGSEDLRDNSPPTSMTKSPNDLLKVSLTGKVGSGMSEGAVLKKETLKELLPETVNYKWHKQQEQAIKRKAREEQLEKKRIHIIEYIPVHQLKTMKFQKLPPEVKTVEPKPQVVKPPKVGIGTKTYNFVNDISYKDLSKKVFMSACVLVLIGIVLGAGFIFVGLTMPYYFVGYQVTIEVPYNGTGGVLSNNTTAPSITPAKPVPPSQVIVVTLPKNPVVVVNNTPPSHPVIPPVNTGGVVSNTTNTTLLPPPPAPMGTIVKDEKGAQHDTSDIPTQYRFQTPFSCYWDLRAKGFGKELNVEYACNSHDTGLWIEACACCRQMYPDRC